MGVDSPKNRKQMGTIKQAFRKPTLLWFVCWFVCWFSFPAVVAAENNDNDFFESRIRPLLITHCLACHGEKKQESGLRLDSRAGILSGGESGPAARPNQPEASLIVQVIRQTGDVQMPPDGKLSPDQIDAISNWIQRGLPWPDSSPVPAQAASPDPKSHWAFQQVQHPRPPAVKDQNWPITKIDHFVLARLEANKLTPADQASPTTLIRRATFDLLGLPPTAEQVTAFESASRDDPQTAWTALIDRLLDSPHYGERQARHWLDVARYADNKGYVFFEQKDYPWAWTYRDWVIQAFNDDLPYDQFLLWQLAADKIKVDDPGSLAAMGFLTVGPRFMNNTHDVIDDRIDVVTRGLLGLTVTCARCHDHKFDPVPQEDYYSLYGIFRSSIEPMLPPLIQRVPDSEQYRSFEAGLQQRITKLETFIDSQREAMMDGARTRAAEYLLAVHHKRNHPTTENFMLLTEKGALIPAMVHRWEVYLRTAKRNGDPVWSLWHRFSNLPEANFAVLAAKLSVSLPAEVANVNPLVQKAFASDPPNSMEDVAKTYAELLNRIDALWRQQLEGGEVAKTRLDDDAAEQIRQVFYGAGSPPMVPRELSWGFLDLLPDRPTQGEFKKLLGEVEKFRTSGAGAPPRAMVLVDSQEPYEPVVFARGNPNREGDRVPRRFLKVLSEDERPTFQDGSGRLELARAIIAPNNPLTARVFVNRIWQQHFGRGLVQTASDFGLRSSPPSHPELLDFLAAEFVASGWSVKKLHRLIMTSAVYKQSSDVARSAQQGAMQIDSANHLLWKFPRRRLDFESMRDAHLAVAQSLDTTLGGPPVRILNGYHRRRTIYGFVDRMDLPGLMRTFDFPEPAATSPGREVTTIPQQALFFLNHEFVAETARRVLRRGDVKQLMDHSDKLDRIHRVLFGRKPTTFERLLADAFLNRKENVQEPKHWAYGYGSVDEESMRVMRFAELKHWTGSRWQAGPNLPDPKLGWLFHDRTGGHPAASHDRCFIRRWTAPVSGVFEIDGKLAHRPEPGNGVRGRVISSHDGLLGQWTVDQSESETKIEKVAVQAGQTIDFVVDFQEQILHDEFEWPIIIRLTDSDSQWDSQKDFVGPGSDPWADYVHALLMTNEFAFVE